MSLSEVSEIAMVPDNECRIPTLIVSAAWIVQLMPMAAIEADSVKALIRLRRFIGLSPFLDFSEGGFEQVKPYV
jgi:hypothetical protein